MGLWNDLKEIVVDTGKGAKSVAIGFAAAGAHAVTNSADMAGKATVVGLSAIPVIGSFVTAAYVFKQSYRNTDRPVMSFLKAVAAGAVAFVPGAGPAITGAYALKNIGEQVQQENPGKGAFTAIKSKYSDAGKILSKKDKMQQLRQNVGKLFTMEGVKDAFKAARKTIGPLTKQAAKAQQEAAKTEQEAIKAQSQAQGVAGQMQQPEIPMARELRPSEYQQGTPTAIPFARPLDPSKYQANAPTAIPIAQRIQPAQQVGSLTPTTTPTANKPQVQARRGSTGDIKGRG